MEIILSDHAGFCFGVKRAIKITDDELSLVGEGNRVSSYGPLIHNPDEVARLESKGLRTIESFEDLSEESIIIRSHGIPKSIKDRMIDQGLKVVDTTCPYVQVVHKRVEKYEKLGYNIIIIGCRNHPEVIGINGWCNNKAYIVNSVEDIEKLPPMDKILIVSQTTNTEDKFYSLSEAIKSKGKEVIVSNTICKATRERQESAAELAKMVDAMIVIGGFSSSNTQKLYEISKSYCKNVFHIEKIEGLNLYDLLEFNTIGITAGASTPDWIIKEAIEAMDNLNNNEMMEAIESSFTRINRGDIVKGEIIFVTDNEIMVNIHYKSDGIISRNELGIDPEEKLEDFYKPGDEIEVFILNIDDGEGNVVLSVKRVEEVKNWEELETNYNEGELLEAKVLRVVKGGLIAEVKGINGFIPASHVSANFVSDLDKFVGETFKVKIIDFDQQKRRIILSRKEVEREEILKKQEEVWSNLEVGKLVTGIIQRLTDFGAFVDLGGVDGLIHISDLSWHRVKHPSEVVKPNEKVEVEVLSFDKEKNRISLGLKQTIEEPWTLFTNSVNEGDVVEGKVVNILDFGAFIRLEQGVDGLLHVSQISKEHIEKPSDVLNMGDQVTVKVIGINPEDKRVSLSIREIGNDNVEEEKEIEEKPEAVSEEVKEEEEDITIGDILNNK